MPKRCRDQLGEDEDSIIPLSIQTFLWRQTSPFIRPRLNKQQDPQISVEQREACKSYEKVLVQNICFNLSTSLTNAIKKLSRWKLIQSALPHVIHCSSTLLYRKNQFNDKLNASDTKLLYTLHWIILDASEECIDAELEQNIIKPPEHYLLPVTTIEVFILQFAPLITYLKGSDFLTNFRLENGYKLWGPLFNHEFPEIASFTNQVKPKRSIFTSTRCERSKAAKQFDDIFIGDTEEKPATGEQKASNNDQTKAGDEQVDKTGSTTITTTTVTTIISTTTVDKAPAAAPKEKLSKEEEARANLQKNKEYSKGCKLADPSMATYLDVAVLRCLFASQWLEEGILWSLLFLEKRLQSIREDMRAKSTRPRSSSLPYQKLNSMMYSLADNIQQRKTSRSARVGQQQEPNKSDSTPGQPQQQQSDASQQQSTGSSLNANFTDASLRRNSYTPSNVSAAEFPEAKSTKFKKQRTEEQLLDAIGSKADEQRSGTTNQSFLANLRSDIQKFGQKRKPKSSQLSAVKKEHHKNRPVRCSSCDILDANGAKQLSKQSSIQSNASSASGGQASSAQNTSSSSTVSATCSQTSSGAVAAQTSRSSPIKSVSTPTTSNQPEQQPSSLPTVPNELQLQASQLLKHKNEQTNSSSHFLRGAIAAEFVTGDSASGQPASQQISQITQQITTITTTVSQSITQSISQSGEHQPAEKRDSNNSSSSTDTTTTASSNTYSISTTTAATISGSLGKGIVAPFQTDGTTGSNLIDESQADAMNPIITITEHSPISSSTNQFFIGTGKQQIESHVRCSTAVQATTPSGVQPEHQPSSTGGPPTNDRRQPISLPIKRCLTDSNVCYYRPSETESLGTLNYITKSGQICLLVILKAVHNISVRENVCTPRVCQGIVTILKELVALGLLEHIKQLEKSWSEQGTDRRARSSDEFTILQLFLDTCMNMFKQIGCEHGCNKQVKPVDVIKTRQDLHALLLKLHDASQTQFYDYFQELVYLKQLAELIDIFHAYLGFCTERAASSANISRESSRKPAASPALNKQLTPTNSQSPAKPVSHEVHAGTSLQQPSSTITSSPNLTPTIAASSNITITTTMASESSPTVGPSTSHAGQADSIAPQPEKLTPTSPKPNTKNVRRDKEQLLAKQKNFKIEEFIIKCTFLSLIERLTRIAKTLNHNEHLSTYCDIRQMLIFIKTYHSTTFRRATLSSLVESTEQLKRRQQAERMLQQQKQQAKEDEQSEGGGVNFYINDENPAQSSGGGGKLAQTNRKSFFKRRNMKTSSSQSMTGEESGTELVAIGTGATSGAPPPQASSTGASESELPIANQLDEQHKGLTGHPSSASFTGATTSNLAKLSFDSADQEREKFRSSKQNTYLLDMLKTKGEETFQRKEFVFQALDGAQQLDSSLSYGNLRSSKMNWFNKADRAPFVKSDQNNNQQLNSDGVFVFSAGGQAREDAQQTKIFTVGGVSAAANLYSGNTLAVAPIAEIRRSSFQSRTYLGKHLGFTNDLNGKSIHRARKVVEDQFFKIHLMSKRPGGPKIANGGLEENIIAGSGSAAGPTGQPELSRKNSLSFLDMANAERGGSYQQQQADKQLTHKELEMMTLKEGKILQLTVLKNGVLKFSFLLESCPPGSLPDAPLIAAVLSLKAPVIARAAFFLELANFVHNCSFGNWPQWMKQNFPILRNSGPTLKPFCRPNPRSLGQNSNLQRYAGRMFYFWGEAISSYLEELMIKEKLEQEKQDQQETISVLNQQTAATNEPATADSNADTDGDQQSLNANQVAKSSGKRSKHDDDEEEDFLDDKTINPNGNDCPYALKFAAVSCLTEITTFLRETHQALKPEKVEKPAPKKNLLGPNSTGATQGGGGVKGFASLAKQVIAKDHSTDQSDEHKPSAPPEKPEKKIAMTASRRWSMALSNLGLSNAARNLRAAAHAESHSTSHSLKESKDHSKETSSSGTHSSSGVVQSTPSSHGERRISFVIHEAEGENNSEHSSNTTLTLEENAGGGQQAHHQAPVKRLSQSSTLTGSSRPNLLNRRGTGTQSISGGSGQAGQSGQQASNAGQQPTINLTNGGTSGSFKRRSIRLKKDRAKRSSTLAEDQEDSGEYGNGVKRGDSIRSRRKVSGISERSDTSDRAGDLSGDESGGVLSDDGQQPTADGGFLMTYGKYSNFNLLEQDDQRLCANMPWFRVVNQLLLSQDYSCKHVNGCTKYCYRRQMLSCSRLIKTICKIYKLETRAKSDLFHSMNKPYDEGGGQKVAGSAAAMMPYQSGSGAFLSGAPAQHYSLERKPDKKSKSIYGSGSPIRRKVSMTQHQDRMIDRDSGHLSLSVHGSSSFLPHLELDAGSSNTTAVYGYSSSAIQPSNFNQIVSQQSDPQKAFLEANRQRLFQKHYVKSRQLYRPTADQSSGEDEFIKNMSKFVENCIRNLFHTPISLLLKGFLVLPDAIFSKLLHTSWHLILESDQHLSCTAACAFILCSFKCSEQATELLNGSLKSSKASEQIAAMRKFQIIWKFRYQCWPRMEENAQHRLKLPPPTIEFTLPSPKIALSSMPVANPPWLPQSKYKVEEVTLNQEQTLQKSFVTATKTRRKQQIEMIHKALADQQEKMREERENYVISSVAIANEASYEPALHKADEHEEDPEEMGLADRLPTHHLQVAQPIFTSAMCSASLTIINLLNDTQVNENGNAVYEMAYKVIWYCLVEDTSLFLRNLFERLTKENGKYILQILRRIIRFMPRLPAQAAFSLYNYLIGFIMYHVRTPTEGSQELIGTTLSVLWLVVPSVHGLFLKGLKQVLRKEQCDAHILITANVPSTKRIIVHGPESVGIPSQFNVQEDTQFSQILSESMEYFSIDEKLVNEYYLLDSKSNQIHNLGGFVRDFYFFKRSQYPQLTLTCMNPERAAELLQQQALLQQFTELGKVLMSLSIVNTPSLAIQRVLFLHEELAKLPAFPRKALESNFQLHHNGIYGKELNGMDTLHKLVWVKLVSRMLEVTSGFFAQSNDIHLFLNVVNGALILHCEDSSILRLCMASFINAAHWFKNIFCSNGYLLIMPTILRIYSNHQTNALLCKTVEFVCKQFYIMHRKPFLLQMFGSASTILDTDSHSLGDATKVQPKAFFQLLQSLASYSNEPMQILDLVQAEKPLRALDFCYALDTEHISILDTISICVTVIGYQADSQRAFQMLTILEAILPLFMKHNQSLTMRKEAPGGPRDELTAIHNISVCIKTLINNCEALTRNFTGPQRAIDLRSSSIKNASKGAYYSPMEVDEDSHSNPTNGPSAPPLGAKTSGYPQYNLGNSSEDNEALRAQFRHPRDVLLNVVCEYLTRSTARLAELSKKIPDLHPSKNSSHELLDVKCHLRLAEIAHSLLKVAPYDPETMHCRGLIRYMNEILPTSDWRQETMRPALIIILRRLDKMFTKIAKKGQIRRWCDWEAARKLLKGIYSTFMKHPYIVHLPHLKSLISVCQYIVLGDNVSSSNMLSGNTNVLSGVGLSNSNGANTGANAGVIGGIGNLAQASSNTAGLSSLLTPDISNQLTNFNSWTTALAQSPPAGFCSVVVRLIALQLLQLNENQTLETICSGIFSSNTEKTEIYLMNMIYPMCIRISGGIKEVPKLRTCDITLILSAILNTLNTHTGKQPGMAWQTAGINKTISVNTLHQIGFLGLKIMIACFERQLSNDWHRIARCIRELTNKNNCSGTTLWKFFDFIVTYRTPLFILLLPLIKYRLLTRYCDNDEEYYYQQQISEKLQGRNFYHRNLSKGNLFKSLFNELNNLKNNLVTKRIDDNRTKPSVPNVGLTPGTLGLAPAAGHRPSFANFNIVPPKSNAMPSAPNLPQSPDDEARNAAMINMNASNNSSINILSNTSTPNRMKSLLNRGFSIRSSISSQSSGGAEGSSRTSKSKGLGFAEKARGLSVRLPSTSRSGASASSNLVDKFLRRTSYPYNTEEHAINPSPPGKDSSLGSGTTANTPSVPNTGNDVTKEGDRVFTFEEDVVREQIDSIRQASSETSSKPTTIQEQSSFDDSNCSEPSKLHRQKAQSKKMFRNRKSKKSKGHPGEASSTSEATESSVKVEEKAGAEEQSSDRLSSVGEG